MSIFDSIKTSIFVPIHPAGIPFIIIFCVFTTIIGWIWSPLFFLGLMFTIWCIYFFRNPKRIVPKNLKNDLVLAPADGKVIEISKVEPEAEVGLKKGKYIKVGIFMNVFNVHVNRSPMNGLIKSKNYIPGLFFNASLSKSSKENERLCFVLDIGNGDEIAFVQIAGLIARRIISDVDVGTKLDTGEIFGLIRFGSRVDVYLPENTDINVLEGQISVAGETIIGKLKKKINIKTKK